MKTYFRLLGTYLKDLKPQTVLILFTLLVQAIVIISIQIAYKEIFDGVATQKHIDFTLKWIFIIFLAVFLRILMGLLTDYLVGKNTLKIFEKIRLRLFHHLQWLPVEFYQRIHIGDVITTYSHGIQFSEIITRQVAPLLIRSFFLAGVSFAILFYFDWRLTLFALCLFPFVLLGALLFLKSARAATKRGLEGNAKLASMTEEVATQHLLLQSFNLQNVFLTKFKKTLAAYKREFMRGIFLRTLVGRTSVFGLSIVEILVFSVGAIMTHLGYMSIGTLFGFFALIWNISGAVSTISDVLPNLIEAGSHMSALQELLSEKTEEPIILEEKGEKKKPQLEKEIVLKEIGLQLSGHTILKNVSMQFPIGKKIGIVGPSGSGKTTVLSLLMGFYSPTKGEMFIDGQDIQQFDRSAIRSKMGLVFQDNPLFNTTIKENIRMGKLDASDQEIVEAAKQAEIHDFIVSLPQGYNSVVKEYGKNLSGGQKQRIALARVYLRNPSLFLLDEPTSALDPIVESQISETILNLTRGKTVILCTHRLAALTYVDHIYVMEKGEVVESGTHDALIRKKGVYYNLWQKQAVLKEKGEKPRVDICCLQNVPLFKDFDEQMLEKIAAEFVLEWREENTVLYEKGAFRDKFYLIVRGKVEVWDPEKPTKPPIAVLEEGDFFGEMALVKSEKKETEIVTRSYCVFLTLRQSQFQEILSQFLK